MNSNGFTKRNVFIGDVSISEDLVCGDMICEEMTLTGGINLDNQDIVGVNNLETKTINGGVLLTNPVSSTLDMAGNNIDNNPQLDDLQDKTQYISVVAESTETQFAGAILVNGDITNPYVIRFSNGSFIDGLETADLNISVAGIGKITTVNPIETTSDLQCDNLTAMSSISAPEITTLQNKTQYLTASANVSTFTGDVKVTNILNGTNLSVGDATPNNTGYFFPPRPLGVNYVLSTGTSASNVLVWTFANLQSIFNLSAVPTVSSTFVGSLFIGGGAYKLPATGPTVANQYLLFDGSGIGSFSSQPNPSYARISRTGSVSGVVVLTAATQYPASGLGAGIFTTAHEKTADITTNLTTGVLTYTGPPKILTLSANIRVSVTAGGSTGNTFNFYLINATTNAILLRDITYIQNTNTRFQLNLSYTQLVPTNFALSFAVMSDANINATFSSLQLAMNP